MLELKNSLIDGKGIFTTELIRKGSIFYEIPLTNIFHFPKSKCAFLGNNTWVEDKKILNYINHSCNANTILDLDKKALIGKRDILAGEEITCNYNETETKGHKVNCNCSSSECKGYFLRKEKPIIGILGGLGPESSAEFYKLLILKLQEQKRINSNEDYPHIFINSISAPECFCSSDLTFYKEGLQDLEKVNTDFVVIICNTAYTFFEELQKSVNIPILNLREEVLKEIKTRNPKLITVFSSSRTLEKGFYHFESECYNPLSKEDIYLLDRIIIDYNNGINKEQQIILFNKLLKKYEQSDLFIIGCTELSQMSVKSAKILDTFEVLLNAILQKLI